MPVIHHGDHEIHLSHDEEEKLNSFQMITTFPEENLPQIVRLLQNHGWNLEPALSRYFDGNWQENLEAPPVAERPPTPGFVERSSSSSAPLIISDTSSFIPRLPIVKKLPLDFKDKFQYAGLDKRTDEFSTHPGLFVLLLLPKVLLKIGTGILTILWSILSFGFKTEGASVNNVRRIPAAPAESSKPVTQVLESILGKESELTSLLNHQPFNDVYDDCERNFKFLLIICIGEIESEETETRDVNSSQFVQTILNDPSTIQQLRGNIENMEIYMRFADDPEMWSLSKQLKLRYTPECLLVGNVLNAKDSASGITRMSVLNRLKVSSLRRFQNSLKATIERHNAELIVSRTEQEELRLAREIKQLQDRAYEESLRQDQVKALKRKEAEEETRSKQEAAIAKEYEIKVRRTVQNLSILSYCIALIKSKAHPAETSQERQATLQIRTPNGKRLIQKFEGDNTLEYVYKTVKCFLFLDHQNLKQENLLEPVKAKMAEMADDDLLLCFKANDFNAKLSAEGELEDIDQIVQDELVKWNEAGEEVELDIDFELVTPFPRFKLPYDKNTLIKSTPQIWPNGSLLVEFLEHSEPESE